MATPKKPNTKYGPPRSEGARLLRAAGDSARQIGAQLKIHHATAARWLTGERTPEGDHARELQRVYSIPAGAWSQRPQAEIGDAPPAAAARPVARPAAPEAPAPTGTATATPEAPPATGEVLSAYALAMQHLEAVRADLARALEDGIAGDVAKFRSLERHAIAAVARLEEQIPVSRARVTESEAWREEVEGLAAVVRRMSPRYPEAFRWLAEELAAHEVRLDWVGRPPLDAVALVAELRRAVELARVGSCPTEPSKLVVLDLRGRDVGAFVEAHPTEAKEIVALLDQAPPLGTEVLEVERREEREARGYVAQIRSAFRVRELVAAFGSDFGSVANARMQEILAAQRAGGAS